MALDLGELRASVVVDQSQVRPGLARVRQRFTEYLRGQQGDAERGGRQTGQALADGVNTAATTRLRRLRETFRRSTRDLEREGQQSGEQTGSALGDGLNARLRSALRRLPDLGRNAGRGLGDNIGSALKGALGAGGRGLGGILSAAGKGLGMFAAGGVLALGTVAAAGATIGTRVASANEQAMISFSTMLRKGTDTADQASARAKGFISDLQAFAAATPFEFADLQEYSSSLISAGIDADKIIPIMRNLGDVTSGMGTGAEGIDRATVALQQMTAAGRITAEDLNQLRDAGIPVYDLLAGATGKSKAEIVKLAQAGKLGKDELKAMLDTLSSDAPKGLERFSGMMAKQSNSMAGVLSTLKDNVEQGLAGVMQNALPLIKDGVGSISKGAERLFGYLNAHQDDIRTIFTVAGSAVQSFGRIIKPVLGAFSKDLVGGQDALSGFADWMSTHQGDITGFFISAASSAISLGRTLAIVAAGGLRAYAGLSDGIGTALDFMLARMHSVTEGMANFLDIVPGMGDAAAAAHRVADGLQAMREQNERDDGGAGKARSMADALTGKLVPALDAAQDRLDKVGKTNIDRARLRDKAAAVANAVEDVGTKANGSRLKLKRWADVSKLGADEQKRLRDKLKDSRDALQDQYTAIRKAHGGQDDLTAAWKKGKDRLYDEFKQMGLSNREARKLAERYAGIKPKVRTKFEAPGLNGVSSDVDTLQKRVKFLKDRKALLKIDVSTNAGTVARSLGMSKANLLQNFADGGTFGVLPGYTPGRDVHRFESPTGGKLNLSGGEAIMRPEWVKAIGGPAEVRRQNLAARTGKLSQDFAEGGVWQANIGLPTNGAGAAVKPGTFANRSNTKAYEAAESWANVVTRALQKSAQTILDRKKAAAEAKAGGGNGGYKGPVGAGAAGIRKLASSFHPSYIAGHRDPQGGPAFDIGSSGSKNTNIGNALRANHGKLGLRYVIRQMQITSAKNGWKGWRAYHPITGSGDFRHVAHVHVSYANGGVLRDKLGYAAGTPSAARGFNWTAEKGAELVVNPQLRHYSGGERVLTAEQTKAKLGGGSGGRKLVETVNLTSSGNVRSDLQALDFALRTIDQRGAYANA